VRRLHSSAEVLAGRTVLIVDGDVRNVFALTSLLERHGMQVISAENGKGALERLLHTPAIDVRDLLRLVLERHGARVVTAARWRRRWRAWTRRRPTWW